MKAIERPLRVLEVTGGDELLDVWVREPLEKGTGTATPSQEDELDKRKRARRVGTVENISRLLRKAGAYQAMASEFSSERNAICLKLADFSSRISADQRESDVRAPDCCKFCVSL